jgi:hypothetical protein
LDQELKTLPDKYRTAVVLCDLEGNTIKEAARQLGCPPGTVGTRLLRGRDILARRLGRHRLALSGGLLASFFAQNASASTVPPVLFDSTFKAAMLVAAGKKAAGLVSAKAAALTEGVLKAMFLKRLTTVAAIVTIVAVGIAGLGLVTPDAERSISPGIYAGETKRGLGGEAGGAKQAAQEQPKRDVDADKKESINNLKIIGIAMHNYHDVHGHLPMAAIYSQDGKPLLSWRVAILPYIDHEALFKQFKLDEPWDSAHNKKLLEKMPRPYVPPGVKTKEPHATFYQVFFGKGAMFEDQKMIALQNVTDGTSNTMMAIEAAEAGPWTKPADLPFDRTKDLPKFGGLFKDGSYSSPAMDRCDFSEKTSRPRRSAT